MTDSPSGSYLGSGVHAWNGCTRAGDYTANCSASGITLIRVSSGVRADKVINSTTIPGSLLTLANQLGAKGKAVNQHFRDLGLDKCAEATSSIAA